MRTLRITVEGVPYLVTVEEVDGPEAASAPVASTPVASARPAAHQPPVSHGAPQAPTTAAPGGIPSPLAGVIVSVDVATGQSVKAGDTLVTLEAMKMRAPVTAPRDGTVMAVSVSVGDTVLEGQALLTLA